MLLKFSTLIEIRLYSWHCWAPGNIPSDSVICPASGRSSCGDHYLTDLESSLCSVLLCSALPCQPGCPGCSRLLAPSPQLLETPRLCLASLSLCHFLLETFPRQSAGAVRKLTLVVSCLRDHCRFLSTEQCLECCHFVYFFFFLNFSCLRWSLLLHLGWKQKWDHLFLNEN